MKTKWILIVLFLGLVLTFPSPSTPQSKNPGKAYKVAILPFQIHSQENLNYLQEGIYDILASRITVEGNISVIDRSVVERAFYEERPMRLDEAVAVKIGRRAEADYVVLGSLTKIGDYISLDARLVSITDEKPPLAAYARHKGVDDVMVKIEEFAQDIGYKILGRRNVATGLPRQKQSSFLRPEEGQDYKKSQIFDFEIKGLDIGDVDGDGKNEVVILGKSSLYVFKYDGDKLSLFQHIQAGFEHNFLSLDVADLNRNGHAEIVVTSVVDDNPRSFILEYEESRFKKITDEAGWYFRVLGHPKDGPILVGQRMGSGGSDGPVYKFDWKKKSFERGAKMTFPKGTNIFGLALADFLGKGKPEMVTLDPNDRLRILSEDGKVQWVSSGRFGGTNNSYDTKNSTDLLSRRFPGASRRYIPGRILVRDLKNEDGGPQVIVNRNEFATGRLFDNIKPYEKGEIWNLVWGESGLTTNWKTREIPGYIADYQVKDADNDGNEDLVVAVVAPIEEGYSGILNRKDKSNLIFFKLF